MIKDYIFGRYEVGRSVSSSGMSSVYEGYDHKKKRDVIIKVLEFDKRNSDKESVQRFISEASLLKDISHPSIVDVYDCGRDDNRLYYIMEHIRGVPLSEYLSIPLPELISVFVNMAEVLCFLHSKGIVHRDIKPENIIICNKREANTDSIIPKLIDFGLARSSEEGRITSKGFIMGSMNYIAPEQLITGEVDIRSDLYSFGVTMYRSLTGRFPFQSDNPDSNAYLMLQSTPEPPSTYNDKIPKEIDDLLLLLLRQEPSERIQTSQELLEELRLISKNIQSFQPSGGFIVRIPDYYGRDWEMRELKTKYENQTSENMFTVAGSFGMGKTRMLDEFSSRLIVNSELQVRARGNSMTRFHDYSGLKQIAFDIAHFNSDILDKIDKAEFVDLGGLHPKLGARLSMVKVTNLNSSKDISKLFSKFVGSLGKRICVIIDDAHMLDDKTLDACIGCATENKNIFLLLSFERNANRYLENLIQKNTEMISSIELDSLDGNSTGKIIQSCLKSQDIPNEIIEDAHHISRGIPLLILDFVRSAVESNDINRIGNSFSYKEGHKHKLKAIDDITKRCISGLSNDSKRILGFMVTYGKPVKLEMITKVFKIKKANGMLIIDELRRTGIVEKHKENDSLTYQVNDSYDKDYIRRTITDEDFKFYSRESAHILMAQNFVDIDCVELSCHLINSNQTQKAVYLLCHYIYKTIVQDGMEFAVIEDRVTAEFADEMTYSNWQTIRSVLDLSINIKKSRMYGGHHKNGVSSIFGYKTKIDNRIQDHIMILIHLDNNHYKQASVIIDTIRENDKGEDTAVLRLIEEGTYTSYLMRNYLLDEVEQSLSIQTRISKNLSGMNRVQIDMDMVWLLSRRLEFNKIEQIIETAQEIKFLESSEKYVQQYEIMTDYLEILAGKFHKTASLESKLSESSNEAQETLLLKMRILSSFFGGDWDRINEYSVNLSDSSLNIDDFLDAFIFPFAIGMLRDWRFDCPFSIERLTRATKQTHNRYKFVLGSILSHFSKIQEDSISNNSIDAIWNQTKSSNSNELILEFCFWMSLFGWDYYEPETLLEIRDTHKQIVVHDPYRFHQHALRYARISINNEIIRLSPEMAEIFEIQDLVSTLSSVKVVSPIIWALESLEIAKYIYFSSESPRLTGGSISPHQDTDLMEVLNTMLDNAEFVWNIVDATGEIKKVNRLRDSVSRSI
ncbi:MAG TPA: serine/threonine-protein kinase [Caldisericia bacterium]|nr:serine/threonine-protein kinase [Caldisericia bacterium]HPF48987.1 serine/threonine-protein kinase [Caldisericia bacterium]HPI83149.1 serine/threonine-protein kinase [Caldisericia bacterium]HPQ92376.1 serine/threonine-protein kinase [Caldisericia bacterium]HRV74526.1 serine/threonine-protein kinase [Caldisericia bacterium]